MMPELEKVLYKMGRRKVEINEKRVGKLRKREKEKVTHQHCSVQ